MSPWYRWIFDAREEEDVEEQEGMRDWDLYSALKVGIELRGTAGRDIVSGCG